MVLLPQIAFVCSLVAITLAQYGVPATQYGGQNEDLPASYAFHYDISSPSNGDVKSHTESREGHEVTGEYSVVQPDGCVRHVRYQAGRNGFIPEIRYEGTCDPANYMAPAGPAPQSGPIIIDYMAPVPASSIYPYGQPQAYNVPAQQSYAAPAQQSYAVPSVSDQQTYAPQYSYSAPAPVRPVVSFSVPVAAEPSVEDQYDSPQQQYTAPVVLSTYGEGSDVYNSNSYRR